MRALAGWRGCADNIGRGLGERWAIWRSANCEVGFTSLHCQGLAHPAVSRTQHKERVMYSLWNRWLLVSLTGIALLLVVDVRSGAGSKKADKDAPKTPPAKAIPLMFEAGKKAVQVSG